MPDYRSRVPRYHFPTDTLEAKEAALATNPLMQSLSEVHRLRVGRRRRPQMRLRPRVWRLKTGR